MSVTMLLITAAVFTLAGFIKGVIGLGLPTVSVGLLAIAMPPAHALAIVIVPAIITNIWQTFAGPYLRDIVRRLWPLMLGTVIGIVSCAGLMTGPYARFGTIILGVLLVIYAIVGLAATARARGKGLADVRLAFFGVGNTPLRARKAEDALAAGDVDAAVAALDLTPHDDIQATGAEKKHLAGVLLRRVAAQLMEPRA